jgi:hypothetical protein
MREQAKETITRQVEDIKVGPVSLRPSTGSNGGLPFVRWERRSSRIQLNPSRAFTFSKESSMMNFERCAKSTTCKSPDSTLFGKF